MSVDQVKAFFDQLRGDEGLRAEAKALRTGTEKAPIVDGLMKIAGKMGYDFDAATLEAGWDAWRQGLAASGELSDEALEAVAGGDDCYYGV